MIFFHPKNVRTLGNSIKISARNKRTLNLIGASSYPEIDCANFSALRDESSRSIFEAVKDALLDQHVRDMTRCIALKQTSLFDLLLTNQTKTPKMKQLSK